MKNTKDASLSAPDWDLNDSVHSIWKSRKLPDATVKQHTTFLSLLRSQRQSFPTKPSWRLCGSGNSGITIKGDSRYSDGSAATDREDMVLENDVVFGRLLEKLETTNDPNWPELTSY